MFWIFIIWNVFRFAAKVNFLKLWQVDHFLLWGFFSSNLSQQKTPTVEILGKFIFRTIVTRKYMRKISAVGLFCCDKFEETPKQKVIDLSKLKFHINLQHGKILATCNWNNYVKSSNFHYSKRFNRKFVFIFAMFEIILLHGKTLATRSWFEVLETL